MKLELTIKVDYLPGWGLWEAAREFVQNAKDAEVEFGAPMDISYVDATQTLRIQNTGVTLPHETLLLGHTTKLQRSDLIGKFGEGLKLAALVLVRQGFDVKIRSGSEVWVPAIVQSEKFNAKVLCFDILTGRKDEQRVRVEVKGISKESWLEIKERFLFLQGKNQDTTIETQSGALLLDNRMIGRIYIKGIFVEQDPKLQYGYNLANAELDRDRRMVERWSRNYEIQKVWQDASAKRPDLTRRFAKLLESNASDLEGLSKYNVASLSSDVVEAVTAEFKERHGEAAVPVASIGESKDIAHLGKTGIVVSEKMGLILTQKLGSLDTIKEALKEEVIERFSWSDLSLLEQDSLEQAALLVSKAVAGVTLDMVEVVAFRSDSILGQYKGETDKVYLARKILADAKETLITLVHEISHRGGGDGEPGHVAKLENIWGTIVTSIRREK